MKTWWLTLGDFEGSVGRIVELTYDGFETRTREVLCHSFSKSRAVRGKGFTGAALLDERALVCGFNAIYSVEVTSERLKPFLVRDGFNDLHHIAIRDGRLWIANTGLDRVDVFSLSGAFAGGFSLTPANEAPHHRAPAFPEDPYFAGEYLDKPLHMRRISDLVHPNHIAFFKGRPLVTRFLDGCVQDLSNWDVVLETPGHPHDGVVDGDLMWFTCTNGNVFACGVLAGSSRLQIVRRLNVFELTGRWGWCRGLWVGDGVLLVGLTRIARMPRQRWCELPFEGSRTSVLILDRQSGELLAEALLGRFGTHPKLFSILEVQHV